VIEAMVKGLRVNKAMLTIKDLFGKMADEQHCVNRLRKLLFWIEGLPLSNMPFIEMGFDVLHEDLIQKLETARKDMKSERFQSIKLKCRNHEFLQPSFLY
jgi:hypothetical protein